MPNGEQKSLPFDDPSETMLFDSLELERPLVFFDLETTGLDLQRDRIVQFAFLRVNPDRTREEWMGLVNPGMPIPPEASRVHRITDDMVASKPLFSEFAPKIQAFLANCDLSGFNIARFDVPFLQAELQRYDAPLDLQSTKLVDAQVIFHRNEPRDLSAAYRFYCGGEHIDAHDAMADVRVTVDILEAQLKKYKHLPRDVPGLNTYCVPKDNRYVTSDRKFYWRNGEAVLSFGKHRGQTLQWLVENERDYLLWMQNGDFSEETKAVIADALQGIFPQYKDESEEND